MDIKIGVGVPNYGTIWIKTAVSLMEMMRLPYEFFPIFQYGAYISQNRELIVNRAIEQKCSHILFVDHDIQFYPVTVKFLVEHDKDIVAGLYNYRSMPIRPMVKVYDKGKIIDGKKEDIPYDMFKVAGIGMGCCLIKTSVFEKLEKPYFPMFDKKGGVVTSEDIGFCEKAIAAGFEIWCDPSLDVKHLGDYEY